LLRRELIDPKTPSPRKVEIASALRTLASAGFGAADPSQWLGSRGRSTLDPIVGEGDDVFISPSEIDRFLECELRWFLEKSGARDGDSQAALLGSTLHVYAKMIADGEVNLDEARSRLERAWHLIDLNSGWVQKAGLNDALRTLTRFFEWHRSNPRNLQATEASFTLEIGRVKVRGSADRIEIDDHGVHFIVDLKTSHDAITAKEAEANQQLATYQTALALGAFEGIEATEKVGGAELVYPATDAKKVTTRSQGSKDSKETIETLNQVGKAMSGARFVATINANCRVCAVRSLCPMQGEGRSIIQ
jgi:RecB family exonuclease